MTMEQGLEGRKPRVVLLSSGNTFNLVNGNFRAYFSPNGRLSAIGAPGIRQLNLGFHGKVIRQMINIVTNAKTTPFNFGVRVAGVDSPVLVFAPAMTIGQFDSGILDTPIPFTDTDQMSIYYEVIAGGAGVLQVERILTLLEVVSVP